MISMPSSSARVRLLPAPGPATTTEVFLDTEAATFAPRPVSRVLASLRDISSRVPVSTQVCP